MATAGAEALGRLFDTRAGAFDPAAARVVLALRDVDALAVSVERRALSAADAVVGAEAVDGALVTSSVAVDFADSPAALFSVRFDAVRDDGSALPLLTVEAEFAPTSVVLAAARFAPL